jgi:hypothetical protein
MSVYYGKSIRPGPGDPLVVVSRGNDPIRGKTVTYEWRGNPTDIATLEAFYVGKRKVTDVRIPAFEGGDHVLQVTTGAEDSDPMDEPLLVKWNLNRNLHERTLWEHNKIKTLMDTVTPTTLTSGAEEKLKLIARFNRDVDNYVEGEEKTTDAFGEEKDLSLTFLRDTYINPLFNSSPSATNLFVAFLSARLRGANDFPDWAWVLRKTTIIYRESTVELNTDNEGKLLTEATLIATEGLNDTRISDKLPDGSWLKTPPELLDMDSDKLEWVQEYWHTRSYEKFIYDDPI